MSKRQKYVYTCPDVIHLTNKHRRQNRNTAIALVVSYAGLIVGGWFASKWVEKHEEAFPDTTETYDLTAFAEQ